MEWLINAAYYAHGYCLSWNPWLIASQAGADFVIIASYAAIPVAILIFLHKRKGLELKGLGRFFAAFIFWCGLTHLIELTTLWFPIYDIQAGVKIITAGISLATAILIFELIPKALAIPSPRELQIVNDQLRSEIAAHEKTTEELRRARDELESKVAERTRSLEDSAEHARTLVKEIAHRSGNLMSAIAAMARQSAKSARSSSDLAAELAGRIDGLARSQDLLLRESWRDLSLRDLVQTQLGPFGGDHAVDLNGPPVRVGPQASHVLGMAFYELATSALKYGAFSNATGRVRVAWHVEPSAEEGDRLCITWTEADGPAVQVPKRRGWGTQVTTQVVASALQGEAAVDYLPEGLMWRLSAPLSTNVMRLGEKP